jgi:ubiquinone/menaquinone biosynthesis C-methylase UbiE
LDGHYNIFEDKLLNKMSDPAENYRVKPFTKSGDDDEIEQQYVVDVYNQVAREFDRTRLKEWRQVKRFLDSLPPGSKVADIGCGNGRHMKLRPDCSFTGCDASESQVELCREKGLPVVTGNVLALPFADAEFDAAISIAVLHHLASPERRGQAIRELARITRPGGQVMIQVWAYEQSERSRFRFSAQDSLVEWKASTGSHGRFYHLFQQGELEQVIEGIGDLEVVESFNDSDNWCVIARRGF